MVFLPRVEALLASTLGYEIATPTELLQEWKAITGGRLYHPQGDGDNDNAHNIYMVYVLSPWGEPERGFL